MRATVQKNQVEYSCFYCGEDVPMAKGLELDSGAQGKIVFHKSCLHVVHETMRSSLNVSPGPDGVYRTAGDKAQKESPKYRAIIPPRKRS